MKGLLKLIKISFYKSRLKHHYLSAQSIEASADCGRALLRHIRPAYAQHEAKVEEYKLKLRELGEPI